MPPLRVTHSQDERLHDLLESMRARFKAVVSTLGATSDYQLQDRSQSQQQQQQGQTTTPAGSLSF